MHTCHARDVSRPGPPIEPPRTLDMSVVDPQEAADHNLRTVDQ